MLLSFHPKLKMPLGNPYLKILNLSELFVVDNMNKKKSNLSLSKYFECGYENRSFIRRKSFNRSACFPYSF